MGCKKELTPAQQETIFYLDNVRNSAEANLRRLGAVTPQSQTTEAVRRKRSNKSRPRSGRPPVITANQLAAAQAVSDEQDTEPLALHCRSARAVEKCRGKSSARTDHKEDVPLGDGRFQTVNAAPHRQRLQQHSE
jgi:hypothetical protein